MAKGKSSIEKVALQCTDCKRRNYTTVRNRKNGEGKLELRKFCKFEGKHTLHKEAKIK